jgi:predicted MFS family arabinose efflux permease
MTLAIEVPFIVYGAWLETTYGLNLSTLGLASAVVGLAELAAELGTAAFTDRLGKRRSVLAGLLGLAGSLAALPLLSGLDLVGALAGVALMLLSFEFSIVSLLPLASELAPEGRASLFSLTLVAFSLSRTVGSLAGGWMWQWERIALHAALGALSALAAALVLAVGLPGVR